MASTDPFNIFDVCDDVIFVGLFPFLTAGEMAQLSATCQFFHDKCIKNSHPFGLTTQVWRQRAGFNPGELMLLVRRVDKTEVEAGVEYDSLRQAFSLLQHLIAKFQSKDSWKAAFRIAYDAVFDKMAALCKYEEKVSDKLLSTISATHRQRMPHQRLDDGPDLDWISRVMKKYGGDVFASGVGLEILFEFVGDQITVPKYRMYRLPVDAGSIRIDRAKLAMSRAVVRHYKKQAVQQQQIETSLLPIQMLGSAPVPGSVLAACVLRPMIEAQRRITAQDQIISQLSDTLAATQRLLSASQHRSR